MKKVVNCLYVHKSNIFPLYCEIGTNETKRVQAAFLWAIDNFFEYEVVKYDLHTKNITLIAVEGWKEMYEPIVGDSVCFKVNGTISERHGGYQVYHVKESFVSHDYTGFDIEEAKERTKLLNSLPVIKANKRRMGSLKWWEQFLKDYSLPVYMKGE